MFWAIKSVPTTLKLMFWTLKSMFSALESKHFDFRKLYFRQEIKSSLCYSPLARRRSLKKNVLILWFLYFIRLSQEKLIILSEIILAVSKVLLAVAVSRIWNFVFIVPSNLQQTFFKSACRKKCFYEHMFKYEISDT